MSPYEVDILEKLKDIKSFLEDFESCLMVDYYKNSDQLLMNILLRNNINFKRYVNYPTIDGHRSGNPDGWVIVFGKTRATFKAREVQFWDMDDEAHPLIFHTSLESLVKLKTYITQNLWQKPDILLTQNRY